MSYGQVPQNSTNINDDRIDENDSEDGGNRAKRGRSESNLREPSMANNTSSFNSSQNTSNSSFNQVYEFRDRDKTDF